MELTWLLEITPLPEPLEEDEQQLRRLDWNQIRASALEHGSSPLGKRKVLMPSKSEANLATQPLEEARRDATFLMASTELRRPISSLSDRWPTPTETDHS